MRWSNDARGMSGTASPRRTIVLAMAKANSVILGRGLHLSLDRYLAWAVPGKCRYSHSKPAVPEGGTLSCLGGQTPSEVGLTLVGAGGVYFCLGGTRDGVGRVGLGPPVGFFPLSRRNCPSIALSGGLSALDT